MDPEADQNHPLVLSTFMLALLLTIPAQIKENVVEWEEQTITQVLAAVTEFWDNIEKYEEEKVKNCCVYCSVKAIYFSMKGAKEGASVFQGAETLEEGLEKRDSRGCITKEIRKAQKARE